MKAPAAFTLVELLVVITIIGVLLSLLAPALDKAVGYAQEARCLANLHQIGLGMQMYTTDFRGYFPPKYMPGTTTAGTYVQTYAAGGQGVPTTTNVVSIYWWIGTAGHTAPFDSVGADKRYVNPYMGYAKAGPTAPIPVALCPGQDEPPGNGRYETVGTSYASNHSYAMSSLMARQTPDSGSTDSPIAFFVPGQASYAGIRITRVQSASRLVAGADGPGIGAGWGVGSAPAWHRPDTYGLLFVDTHATMQTFKHGEETGPGYTFDETGRE